MVGTDVGFGRCVTYLCGVALSVWMGTRRGCDAWLRFCDAGQCDGRALHQRYLGGDLWEHWPDGDKG